MRSSFLVTCFAISVIIDPARIFGSEYVQSFERFRETSLNSVTARGWIQEFLQRQKSGLTGHRAVLCYPYNTGLWSGPIERVSGHGADWWRYEQTAYITDGLLRLGYVLRDQDLINDGHAGIEYILAHPSKTGRLGFDICTSKWPFAVFFRAMQADYLSTGDKRIINALRKHYLSFEPKEFYAMDRDIVNIEGMLWTYGQTGDRKLLDLAEAAYNEYCTNAKNQALLNLSMCLSPNKIGMHGVRYMELAKLPAILFTYTGKQEYLDASVNAMNKLDRDHMLPDGVPSSNEGLAGKNPLMSHETCDITDYCWSLGYLLENTGDAKWADRIEKAIFNAGPGCVSKDFKNLQYFSSVNQVIATGESNHNSHAHGSTWMAYWPCHETECCAGNVHRFMPNYVARMWMRDRDGALVAALYGPSIKRISLDGGKSQLTVTEETDYPFSDRINFTFDTKKPVTMPFSFRIPGWCKKPGVTVNGQAYQGPLAPSSFVTIKREFRSGDRIVVSLPMDVNLVKWGSYGIAIERGPLLYSYAVPEKVTIDTKVYKNLHGKKAADPDFPALDIRPNGPWNYALAVNPENVAARVRVVENRTPRYPLDAGASPVVLKVPARRVNEWELVENRYTPPLPKTGQFTCSEKVEVIDLVPYGSTRLRVSVFPVAGQ